MSDILCDRNGTVHRFEPGAAACECGLYVVTRTDDGMRAERRPFSSPITPKAFLP